MNIQINLKEGWREIVGWIVIAASICVIFSEYDPSYHGSLISYLYGMTNEVFYVLGIAAMILIWLRVNKNRSI